MLERVGSKTLPEGHHEYCDYCDYEAKYLVHFWKGQNVLSSRKACKIHWESAKLDLWTWRNAMASN